MMIRNINNANIKVIVENKKIELPQEIQKNIEQHWEKAKLENLNLWNGELMCVSDCQIDEKEIVITCKKSDYAHYLYDERIGLPKEYGCSSLVAGCLLETSDNYYIVGELAENTSFPHCMQISGGSADKDDIDNSEIDIFKTIIRECEEELNIQLENKKQIKQHELKYISLPTEKVHTYIVFSKGKLKIDSTQMKKHYNEYLKYLKDNNLEIEFGKLHFIQKSNVAEELELITNPKREYLKQLLEIDSKN